MISDGLKSDQYELDRSRVLNYNDTCCIQPPHGSNPICTCGNTVSSQCCSENYSLSHPFRKAIRSSTAMASSPITLRLAVSMVSMYVALVLQGVMLSRTVGAKLN
jgi:hypothetical protein